jgi:hypothetical protein
MAFPGRGDYGRHRRRRKAETVEGGAMTAVQAQNDALRVDELRLLEAEAVHIIREVVAELERPVLLFSAGKDSIVHRDAISHCTSRTACLPLLSSDSPVLLRQQPTQRGFFSPASTAMGSLFSGGATGHVA